MERRKIIIDTDAGIDDAMAIMMALHSPELEVIAITCVRGNTELKNVYRNVKRTLKTVHKGTEIPVYLGSAHPIMGVSFYEDKIKYHGMDGFGDVSHSDSEEENPDKNQKYQNVNQHAALILNDLSKKYPGEVTVIALGPLTNLALAIRMDPKFTSRLESLHIMGGNIEGKGNSTSCAEFNFISDVEAAFIVLNETECQMTIVPWETCLRNSLSLDCREKMLSNDSSPCSKLINRIEKSLVERIKSGYFTSSDYILCDQILVAVAIDPKIATKIEKHCVTVEREGTLTKGQMILDTRKNFQTKPNADVVFDIDMEKFLKIIAKTFSHQENNK